MAYEEKIDKVIYSHIMQSNPLEEECKMLRDTVTRLDQELRNLKMPALMVCEVTTIYDKNQAIIRIPNGNKFLCNVASDCEELKPGDHVLVEQKNLNVIRRIANSKKFNVEKFVILEKPTETWSDIGGLNPEVKEMHEVIELALKKPELFQKIGITPPKGILLYGPPGTGKTLLAKAVANSTNATFIQVTASELVQKFIGEGAKLIKEIFELARHKAPTIIFIDELDALASRRMELGTSGEREVNRTFTQLLAEIDGFKPLGNVKVIGATNSKEILDPAITRPGRLDRLIHVGLPDEAGRVEILTIHTKGVKLGKNISLQELAHHMEAFSGAEIRSVVTEAGYFAIRSNRSFITHSDIKSAITKVKHNKDVDDEPANMFG